MSEAPLHTLLLLALPASGKSEIRRYLAHVEPDVCLRDFGLGETVQLDDFPYVHFMRRVSQEARALGRPGTFFLSDALPMRNAWDWGTLTVLLDEDWGDTVAGKVDRIDHAAEWLAERVDRARARVGLPSAFAELGEHRDAVLRAVEPEAQEIADAKKASIVSSLAGKTILLEFARGGAAGSEMPLPEPFGYGYALGLLRPELQKRAGVLYVQVDPEESRRKNRARANPDDPGSILHHGVPEAVMYADYGCDDILWLQENADRSGAVSVGQPPARVSIPIGVFDNRDDRTTFLRDDPAAWPAADVQRLHGALAGAFAALRSKR